LSQFVDFGEVSETCTPVSAGKAAQSFRPTIDLSYMGMKWTHVNLCSVNLCPAGMRRRVLLDTRSGTP
jgi:hypothetical protein